MNSTERYSLVSRIEVIALAQAPGTFWGGIEVQVDDDSSPPDMIPVIGRVSGPVTLSPSTAVLPRHSRAGDLFEVECVLSSIDQKPLRIRTDNAPPGLQVHVLSNSGDSSAAVLHIEWDPAKGESETSKVLRFRALVGEEELPINLPIVCTRPGDG
jgi:hypothetical protein